jgi:molybdopterin biosynthesis enzyme
MPGRSGTHFATPRLDCVSCGRRIRTAPWKGSSDLAGLSRANGWIVIPQGEGMIEVGERAGFLPIE